MFQTPKREVSDTGLEHRLPFPSRRKTLTQLNIFLDLPLLAVFTIEHELLDFYHICLYYYQCICSVGVYKMSFLPFSSAFT